MTARLAAAYRRASGARTPRIGAALVVSTLAALSLAPPSRAQGPPTDMGPLGLFFVGVATAFCFLHLMIFLFQREDRGHLYLSIAAGCYAASAALGDFGMMLTPPLVLSMILAFLRFAHWFTYETPPRRPFLAWCAAAALAWILGLALRSVLPFWAFVAASLVELVRALVRGPIRRRSGDWLVAVGFGAIFIGAAGQGVADLATGGGGSQETIYPFGMLALFVAMSIYLSLRYATVQRELTQRLSEVETLSARTLAQEREARERELERRVLEIDNARKTAELDAARRLQLSLLPAGPPRLDDVEVAFAMRTATEVGGDYYDYRGDDGSLTLALGDATGHGADAGILVATVKGLFHTTRLEQGLRAALVRVSEGVSGLGLRRHHMSLALLRYAHGTVRFAAAGMPPLLVHRAASGEIEEILLEAPPLGVSYERPYPELQSRVEPGDTLLLVSDGLPERRNERDEPFGYDQLRAAFAAAVTLAVEAIPEHLFAHSDRWAGGTPQSDDMTAAVLRVRARAGASEPG